MALYPDHNATSPRRPGVFEAMLPFLRNPAANPSSRHESGRVARSAVETAREEPAQPPNCSLDAVIFASGGAENVAGLVDFGRAARRARLELSERRHYLKPMGDAFESRLGDIAGAVVFAADAPRLPNTRFCLPCDRGEMPSMALERAELAVISGSVCDSAVTEPTDVPRAMGVDQQLALNPIRGGFGMDNTLQQVEQSAAVLRQLVERLPAVMRRAAG